MKVYLSKLNESWVVDRFRKDWIVQNKSITTKYALNADIVWIISPWLWGNISKRILKNKIVVCSVYHIDFNKFDEDEVKEFKQRDKFVDYYHVISKKTEEDLKKLTSKTIFTIPFWIDPKKYFHISDKGFLKKKYDIDVSSYVVGSFQRDTEGSDLKSPKLIKGPDIFLRNVINIKEKNENLLVLLTGKRRNYLIGELEKNNINFKYFEMVNQSQLNDLYNLLDLYIVSSRVEGGPQAILECALTKTPIVSTDVGVASEILSKNSIYELDSFEKAYPDIEYAFAKVQKFVIPEGMKPYREMFVKIYEN